MSSEPLEGLPLDVEAVEDRVVLKVLLVAADATGQKPRELTREWTLRQVQESGVPDLGDPAELEFLAEPRRSWPNPRGPIVISALVVPGHEYDAQEWLGLL